MVAGTKGGREAGRERERERGGGGEGAGRSGWVNARDTFSTKTTLPPIPLMLGNLLMRMNAEETAVVKKD